MCPVGLWAYICTCMCTKKVVGISTISRLEHSTAQTRELVCTKDVLPQVLQRGACVYACMYVYVYIHAVLCGV